MEETELVVSLETGKRLKDKGYPQGKSYFVWTDFLIGIDMTPTPFVCERSVLRDSVGIDAPTVSELLAELPLTKLGITINKEKNRICLMQPGVDDLISYDKSLSEALASLWLKIKEAK